MPLLKDSILRALLQLAVPKFLHLERKMSEMWLPEEMKRACATSSLASVMRWRADVPRNQLGFVEKHSKLLLARHHW
jgi:hypothetical protein